MVSGAVLTPTSSKDELSKMLSNLMKGYIHVLFLNLTTVFLQLFKRKQLGEILPPILKQQRAIIHKNQRVILSS